MFVRNQLPTKFGDVEIVITGGNHVCLNGDRIVYRGRQAQFQLHLFSYPDSDSWILDRTGQNRPWTPSSGGLTPVGLKIVVEEVTRAWNEWIPDHRDLLVTAEIERIEREIEDRTKKINKLKNDLSALEVDQEKDRELLRRVRLIGEGVEIAKQFQVQT